MNGTTRCPADYVSPDDGWHYTCDLPCGHSGPHKAQDCDLDNQAWKEAEWLDGAP